MTRDEWLALAIAAADDPGIAPIQLQQSLFLFQLKREKDSGPDFYQFEPHNYGSAAKEAEGPFSKALYADLDALVDEGLVSKTWQPGEACSLFRPTEAGQAWVKDLRRQAKKDPLSYLEEAVAWVGQQSAYESVHKTATIRIIG
jgi:DNA-binding PadR family transcriptional regulator